MMGDPGPSDLPVLPSVFGNQVRDDFPGQVLPISGLQASVPTSSTELYPRPLPYSQPLDHQPTVSFRQDGYEEWSHRITELAADDLFTYPENEEGAVTITRRDLEGLQPGRFLSDNIIDFYIKYMSITKLSQENQRRFHFFTSFFFSKLLESTSSIGFNQCKVDYKELRKWVWDVNLFEKDYIFIPIIERLPSSPFMLLRIGCNCENIRPLRNSRVLAKMVFNIHL